MITPLTARQPRPPVRPSRLAGPPPGAPFATGRHGFGLLLTRVPTAPQVRAVNVVGQGERSNVVSECTVKAAGDPTRPTNVVVDKVTTRSIYMRWRPPLDNGGAPVAKYHITYKYLTWQDIKGPLRGGLGGRVTTTGHVVVDNPSATRFKITNLAGDTPYDTLCIQVENAAGRLSKRSPPIEGLRTLACNDLQTCQNEMERVRGLTHAYCDTDTLTKGEVIQRLLRTEYLAALQDKYDLLQSEGLELDPPSDDEEWLRAGDANGLPQHMRDSVAVEQPVERAAAEAPVWPKVQFKMFLPLTGRVGDEMVATAPSGWVSHVVVPAGAKPGEFFEVEVENRPMRRMLDIRRDHFAFKIGKLHRQVADLDEQADTWAEKRNFNAYRLNKLEQRYRIFAGEADRIDLHEGVRCGWDKERERDTGRRERHREAAGDRSIGCCLGVNVWVLRKRRTAAVAAVAAATTAAAADEDAEPCEGWVLLS